MKKEETPSIHKARSLAVNAHGSRLESDIEASGCSRLQTVRSSRKDRAAIRLSGRDTERDKHLMAQIYRYLSRLAPETRRTFIAQEMTQTQRLALERWMLQGFSSSSTRVRKERPCNSAKLAPACGSVVRHKAVVSQLHGSAGYPCVHLGCHLYAQSSKCNTESQLATAVAALGELQARCGKVVGDSDRFRRKVVAALSDLQYVGLNSSDGERLPLIYLRTRISFSRDLRLSSPVRHDMDSALDDWHCLISAWGASVFCGAKLRADCTPDAADQQWKRTCQAWHDIWLENGRPASELKQVLAAKEAKRRPRWRKTVSQWQHRQRLAASAVTKLISSTLPKADGLSVDIRDAPQEVSQFCTRPRKRTRLSFQGSGGELVPEVVSG